MFFYTNSKVAIIPGTITDSHPPRISPGMSSQRNLEFDYFKEIITFEENTVSHLNGLG